MRRDDDQVSKCGAWGLGLALLLGLLVMLSAVAAVGVIVLTAGDIEL